MDKIKCPNCGSNDITIMASNYMATCRHCGRAWHAYHNEELRRLEEQIKILEMKVTDLFGLVRKNYPTTRYYKRVFRDGKFVNVELSRDDLRKEIL